MNKKLGRPKKYKTKTVSIGATIPQELSGMIDDFAYQYHCNKSEAIVILLQSADKEMAKTMLEYLKDDINLRRKLKNHKMKTVRDIYSKIEIDDVLKNFVEGFKKEYNKIKINNPDYFNAYKDRISSEFQEHMLKEGKIINRPNLIKLQIKRIMLDWRD